MTTSSRLINTMKQAFNLFQFHGGIHVDSHKSHASEQVIHTIPIPEKLFIPLSQHIGQAAIAIVNIGDKVLKGQLIADIKQPFGAKIHAPTSGYIEDIGLYAVPHHSALNDTCIVIACDGKDQWQTHHGVDNPELLSTEQIFNLIKDSGIVGLGGAAFPAAVKVKSAQQTKITTLIINGAECEPYISCDEALMNRRAEEIVLGARLIQKAITAENCIIALEDDIPDALQNLLAITKNYQSSSLQVVAIPELYPSGSEKQLIKIITGLEVPSGKIPAHVGISCVNVATAAAIYRAVYQGEPLISRLVTLTGTAIPQEMNVEALIGTPIEHLLDYANYHKDRLQRVIVGGPMMGLNLSSVQVPLVKATNCVLASAAQELSTKQPAMPCIRCSRCADSCPMSLLPQQLYWHSKAKEFDKTNSYHLFDCIECGCCDYVCPSNIPLVEYFRFAKSAIKEQQQNKQKSDIARQRHEQRDIRLARIKQEKALKRQHMQARKKAMAEKKALEQSQTQDKDAPDDAIDDPIKAAMLRVQAKKQQQAQHNSSSKTKADN